MGMQEEQQLELLKLRGAPNDEVSYLGVAFNSLASTIDNLMTIFKKFVARDVAAKAYREREIRLEGERRILTILFTDIKSFTFMTETLGTDIIKLLNLHYDRAIRYIHENNGDIGSIIGDALLAVFGVMEEDRRNKSLAAVEAAYRIQEVAASRLEGLTRFYKVPVVVSRYVRDEVELDTNKFWFVELDRVQVKGKTEGKEIFWPVRRENVDDQLEKDLTYFDQGLKAYYQGDWRSAEGSFRRCTLGLSNTFLGRIRNRQPPKNWNGVWTMKEK